MRPEYAFSKGRRGKYAGRVTPADTEPRNIKVRVTVYLDAAVAERARRLDREAR